MLLSNAYFVNFWYVFEFNVADMEGIYTKRQVIIPVTKKPSLWFKQRGFKVLIRDELYEGRKLYSEIFKTSNIIVQGCLEREIAGFPRFYR